MTRYSLRFTNEDDAQAKRRLILREYPHEGYGTIATVYKEPGTDYWIVDVLRGTSCD